MPAKNAKLKRQARAARTVLAALPKDVAKSTRAHSVAALSAAKALAKVAANAIVTFTCSHAGCVVGITCAGVNFAFTGTGATQLPSGTHSLFYRVNGPANAPFTLQAGGATMPTISGPTDSQGRAAGSRSIQV